MKLIFRGNQRRKRDHCETLISRTIARSCSFIHSRHWLITLERGEKKATYPPRQEPFLGRAQCGYRTSIYRFNVPRNLQEGTVDFSSQYVALFFSGPTSMQLDWCAAIFHQWPAFSACWPQFQFFFFCSHGSAYNALDYRTMSEPVNRLRRITHSVSWHNNILHFRLSFK